VFAVAIQQTRACSILAFCQVLLNEHDDDDKAQRSTRDILDCIAFPRQSGLACSTQHADQQLANVCTMPEKLEFVNSLSEAGTFYPTHFLASYQKTAILFCLWSER